MGTQFSIHFFVRRLTAFLVLMLAASFSHAQTETILHDFSIGSRAPGGNEPWAGLIRDSAGNFYGTTNSGGTGSNSSCPRSGCGTVFKLSPASGGGWIETVLHNFNWTDGANPSGNLMMDSAGNLFGSAIQGGAFGNCGTLFELTPNGKKWTFQTIYNFCSQPNGVDGMYPLTPMIKDRAGNLYGVASEGGDADRGVAFEMSPASGGTWTYKILHTFSEANNDGTYPVGALTFDASGNLWGTTETGGSTNNSGTIYEFTPTAGGGWAYTLVYAFGNPTADVQAPFSGVVIDGAGNMYGTAYQGGANYEGGVFELSPKAGGGWTETVIHSFNGNDGISPYYGNLAMDAAGNLYGTTLRGTSRARYGTVYKLSPNGGNWTETILHEFSGKTGDGRTPYAGLALDSAGNVYGTASQGGNGGGIIFKIKP